MTMHDTRTDTADASAASPPSSALCAAFAVPALVAAHPLGNFTINHYAGVRVEPDRVLLDVVVDQAEIPTFQARLGFDTDGDGDVSDAETDAGRATACESLEPSLALTVDGARQTLVLDEAGLTFPSGVGGLNTMRIVCGFSRGARCAARRPGPGSTSPIRRSRTDSAGARS